jgi:hypothetical protein
MEAAMKAHLLLPTLFFLCFSCTLPKTEQLSPQLKLQIQSEVEAVADSIWAKWVQLDPEAAFQYYSDSPGWLSINSQGSSYDLTAYRRLASDFKKSATAYKWTTLRRDFNVLSEDIAICDWIGKDEATWKSGDKAVCDPHAYTLIFKKMSAGWRLAYSHDSGVWATQKGGKR